MKKFIAAACAALAALTAISPAALAAPAATLKIISQPVYEDTGDFSEGLCWVTKDGENYQYIDEDGNVVIDNINFNRIFGKSKSFLTGSLAAAMDFHEGLAAVIGNPDGLAPRTVYIDKKGKIALRANDILGGYVYGSSFIGGLAVCSVYDGSAELRYVSLLQGDGAHRELKGGCFEVASSRYANGLIPVAASDGQFGYLNGDSQMAIKPQYQAASPFYGGVAFVMQGDKWGMIDTGGNYIVKPEFDGLYPPDISAGSFFSDGFMCVRKGLKWGFIDEKGALRGGYDWDSISVFKNGLAPVQKGELYGYINTGMKTVIKPQYDDANFFYDGCALVGNKGVYKLIDEQGRDASSQTWNLNMTRVSDSAPNMVFYQDTDGYIGVARIVANGRQ